MTETTLLSHLADRFVTQRENLATEALAYLLQRPAIGNAFQQHVLRFCPDLGEIRRVDTQQSSGDDAGIPDLVGIDADGRPSLLVEAKFAAALTANQPVTYLRRLTTNGEPGLLLFVVPQRRTAPVWAEIQHRCDRAGMALTDIDNDLLSATWQRITVGVTTWSNLLDELQHALNPSDHRRELSELAQLRGLCEREDREAFVPLTSEEMGGTLGQRLLDLDSLLNESVAILQVDGLVDLRGLKWSAGQGWFGRYLRLGEWTCLLHVNFERWGRQRPTPLWLRVTTADVAAVTALATLAADNPPRLLNDDGRNLIPIMLPIGVDRDDVMAEIQRQLREIHKLLARVSPVGPNDVPVDANSD